MMGRRGAAKRSVRATRASVILISICLVVLIWTVFGQTIGFDFVNYDDRVYVYQNPIVSKGLTLDGFLWAFAHTHARNWHPLTTLSHMTDCQVFGLKAGGPHLTNVFLHTVAVLLLFFVLQAMTGLVWPSAFVAALFAVHPLHVESVAWVAERKDVLSAVFFGLTLLAYTWYVRRPVFGRYFAMLVFFACGLLSKSMLVTMPIVLLLLDYWPLGRSRTSDIRSQTSEDREQRTEKRGQRSEVKSQRSITRQKQPRIENGRLENQSWSSLVVEKIPLFALSIGSGLITFFIQERSAGSLEQLPLGWRFNNAILSTVTYVRQLFWPTRLAVFYPHPENHLAIWMSWLALGFLIAVTALVFLWRKERPYLLVGWLWYVVMLLPVIGIVQVGLQGHADRYTYLPHIGLYLALIWLVADLVRSWHYGRVFLGTAAGTVLAILSACAWHQTSYWRDSATLWSRALAVTSDNETAHTNLGMVLLNQGQLDEALSHLQTALQIVSKSGEAHYNLTRAIIHCDLASALVRKDLPDEAIWHLRQAVELQPNYSDAHYNLATVLFQNGEVDQAIAEWRTTLLINPNDAEAHTALANVLLKKGEAREAMMHYQTAIEAQPVSIMPLNNLAWVLATSGDSEVRDGRRALELADRAVQLSRSENPTLMRTLAAAYAANGRFTDAIDSAEQGVRVAREQNRSDLADALEKDLVLYRERVPLRASGSTSSSR
jgi:tetratricopeptide (TPR) repeat protein